MSLSDELVSQFAKIVSKDKNNKRETTVYGTVKKNEETNEFFVHLDGADENCFTPITTTADLKDGDRVNVLIKNHTATVVGNRTSPAARVDDVTPAIEAVKKVDQFETILADKVSTEELNAQKARIDKLQSDNVTITSSLAANEADIDTLQAENVEINKLLAAAEADIDNLQVTKLSAEDIDGKYANIDFSNIGKAAIEYFYSHSGLIENVVVGDETITGKLVGVTISGDIILGNTVIADKLVIKGEDGLYYKLNTDGVTTEAEQTDENSLNGSVIKAKSITASKISVDDLVAFDATIGGFNITEKSIYSEVKDSEGNTTRGIYMDTDGQVNIGDDKNFIKYFKDEDGTYKLFISADTILYDVNGNQYSISDLGAIGEYVKIGVYEDEPCIELGETDSDFKLLITNTKIVFLEGSNVPAYFTNQALHIKKAVIEEELQQGGFVWRTRSNGNMGLVWKGVSE